MLGRGTELETGNLKLETGDLSKEAGKLVENPVLSGETEDPQHATRNSQLATILVVEDNPDNMTTLRAVLGNSYNMLEATDGKEGLKAILEERPDLVLLDISLPLMDGYQVVQEIKENKDVSDIPVIAMTAHAMKGDKEKILAAGCDDYISKPIDPETVLEKIRDWVER